MPITINGTGSITGLSAGGLPDASVTLADLETSVASGVAKAWVNFNGTGTVAIRASLNVSSITDNGVGRYTVNIESALPNAIYSIVSCGSHTNASTNAAAISIDEGTTPTASAFAIRGNQGSANLDPVYCNVAVFD